MKALFLPALLLLLCSVAAPAQQTKNAPTKDLVDRLADNVSAKEPGLKLVAKRKRRGEDISNLLGWRSSDDFVSVSLYEYASPEEAAKQLLATINAPVQVISETIKLKDVGDEAYIRPHGVYSKPGSTSFFFRRRNVMVNVFASSPEIATRFAKEMIDEIDKEQVAPKSVHTLVG